jgi:beta-N-acetylhexosaminidase
MTSHLFNKNLDAKYPATISKKIINDLLRKKLNFDGVVISDDPQMKALSKRYSLKKLIELMINAGVDILCFGNNMIYDENIVKKIHILILELLNENKVSISMLEKANERITKLKNRVGLK